MRYPDAAASEQELLREIMVGVSRFGSDPKTRARWLLDFVERDLSTREAARDAALQMLLFALAGRFTGEGARAPARMDAVSGEALDPQHVREVFSSVERLQREVKEALTAFASDGRCRLPFKIVGLERLPDGRVLTAGSNPEPRHLESHGGERGHPRACGRSTGPSLAAECSTGSRAVKECFRPLPILVDSTRRNLLIRWQKRAAAWEHGFESRWGHQIVFVDV